jgi:hypothetical protein
MGSALPPPPAIKRSHCKHCNQLLDYNCFSASRLSHHICRSCDKKKSLWYQKKRQSHPSYKSIWKVKDSIRKLRQKGLDISKKSWLSVKNVEAFFKKWNYESALCLPSPKCGCSIEVSTDLVFWFQNMNGDLTFDNAFPCTIDELDTIVGGANGNLKVGAYILTNGDDEKTRQMLENLRQRTTSFSNSSMQN